MGKRISIAVIDETEFVPVLRSAGLSLFNATVIISQKVFIKSFGKSQFPHKSANVSFIITNIKNKLTDLCGN